MTPLPPSSTLACKTTPKINYLAYDKVLLTALVSRHHVGSAYGTYILHPLVVAGLSLLVAGGLPLDLLLKLALVAPLAVAGSFSLGRLPVAVPGADTIL